MSNEVKLVKDILTNIFSDNGYDANGINLKCKTPTTTRISNINDNIVIEFDTVLPRATIQKFISFKLDVQGIVLKNDGGIIRIKHFPDISFTYDKNSSSETLSQRVDFSYAMPELESQYGDEGRREIAKKCLHYAEDWATIVSSNGFEIDKCKASQKFFLKKQCASYIKDCIRNDEEVNRGSVLLTIIILNVIVPLIIRWIVEKVIDNWIN